MVKITREEPIFALTLPNLGFFLVLFEYPKISKNGNALFFPVILVYDNDRPRWKYRCFFDVLYCFQSWFLMLFSMLFSMLVFDVDFLCCVLTLIFTIDFQCFSKCRFPNKIFLIVFLLLNYNFFHGWYKPMFFLFFLDIYRFCITLLFFYLFFPFLSLMFFCFFLFFILSSQNRTYFTMITLGHHTPVKGFSTCWRKNWFKASPDINTPFKLIAMNSIY